MSWNDIPMVESPSGSFPKPGRSTEHQHVNYQPKVVRNPGQETPPASNSGTPLHFGWVSSSHSSNQVSLQLPKKRLVFVILETRLPFNYQWSSLHSPQDMSSMGKQGDVQNHSKGTYRDPSPNKRGAPHSSMKVSPFNGFNYQTTDPTSISRIWLCPLWRYLL